MTRRVIRIEPYLTRDYIDREQKMRSLRDVQPSDPHVSKLDLVAMWVVLAGLMVWVLLVW